MIQTRNLLARFCEGAAIRYADLNFEAGASYVLLGASGCGKSTLLNLIAGVLTPSEGAVTVGGETVSAWPQRRRDAFRIREVGYVYQDFKLIESMTVQDNIDILRMEGVDTSGKDALLDRLGILSLKKRRVRSLSGGEKQRVAIARALIKQPNIILADEPTGNLNYEIGRAVMQQLIENMGGGTLIAVTHDDRLAPMFDHTLDMNAIARFESGREAAADA
ncbi:MAG: ATP-binding cassette domain-containing protein [Eubacteriales bacterium]|nr:ATP-binding cassette domain-containing protein [Eubacteriales bacterium]